LPVLEQLLPILESMANFIGNNTEAILIIGAVVGTLAGAIVALNTAMAIYNTVQAITTTLNAVLAGSFTALWVATGIGIIVAIIAAIVVLQMKFNILGHAVDALKWVFEQAWGVIKTMLNGAIDGINLLIKAINLIPGIDIPELTKFADDVETASERVDYLAEKSLRALEQESKAADEAIVPLMYSIEGVRRAGDEWQSTLGRVNVETDKLNEGVETATTRLDRFFESLDKQEAADEFVETLKEIETRLRGVKEGTAEWEKQQNLAYEALRALRTEREDLSDAFFEVLKLEIDTGDLERAYTLMANLVNLGGVLDVPQTFQDLPGLNFTAPSFADPEGISASATNIVNVGGIYMPAGTDGDDIIRALQDWSRKNGAINVPITDTSRL